MKNAPFVQASIESTVLFHEVDTMNVVWHGHYFKYFEAARSKLCLKHHIDIADFIKERVYAPIGKVNCKYKRPLFYNDRIRVTATCAYQTHPKLVIDYSILRIEDNTIRATGRTEQLFLDESFQTLFEQPPLVAQFFEKMKQGKLS